MGGRDKRIFDFSEVWEKDRDVVLSKEGMDLYLYLYLGFFFFILYIQV